MLAAHHIASGEHGVLIDLYCASYAAPPQAITLDIDDTCDRTVKLTSAIGFSGYFGS